MPHRLRLGLGQSAVLDRPKARDQHRFPLGSGGGQDLAGAGYKVQWLVFCHGVIPLPAISRSISARCIGLIISSSF